MDDLLVRYRNDWFFHALVNIIRRCPALGLTDMKHLTGTNEELAYNFIEARKFVQSKAKEHLDD